MILDSRWIGADVVGMTRTSEPTPTDPNTAALVRIVGLMAIVMLVALGYLMVQKSNTDRQHSVDCVVAQSRSYGRVPADCR